MIKRLAGKSLMYFTATLLNRGLSLLLLPIYTRYLVPADYGILKVCGSLSMFLGMIASFALEGSIQVFYFQLEPAVFRRYLSALWVFIVIVPLVLIGGLVLLGPAVYPAFFPEVPPVDLTIALWTTYVGIFLSVGLRILQTKQWARAYTLASFGSALLTAVFSLYFIVVRSEGALGNLRGQLIGSILMAIGANVLILRYAHVVPKPEFDWGQLRAAFFFSLPYVPYTLCMWVTNYSDVWVLNRCHVPLSDIGLYGMAYSMGMLMISLGTSLASAFGPYYCQRIKEPEFRQELPRLATLYAFVPTWITLAIAVSAPEIVRVFTQPTYYGAKGLIPWIVLAYWFHIAIYQLQILVIEYHRQTHWLIWLASPAAALNVGLNFLLVPWLGVYAAAINTVLSFALLAGLARLIARKLDPIPYRWNVVCANVVVALVSFAIGWQLLSLSSLLFAIIAKGVLLLAAGAAMVMNCGYRPRDLRRLVS
jgi:O-antigen/teichoic acid export membrane protein